VFHIVLDKQSGFISCLLLKSAALSCFLLSHQMNCSQNSHFLPKLEHNSDCEGFRMYYYLRILRMRKVMFWSLCIYLYVCYSHNKKSIKPWDRSGSRSWQGTKKVAAAKVCALPSARSSCCMLFPQKSLMIHLKGQMSDWAFNGLEDSWMH